MPSTRPILYKPTLRVVVGAEADIVSLGVGGFWKMGMTTTQNRVLLRKCERYLLWKFRFRGTRALVIYWRILLFTVCSPTSVTVGMVYCRPEEKDTAQSPGVARAVRTPGLLSVMSLIGCMMLRFDRFQEIRFVGRYTSAWFPGAPLCGARIFRQIATFWSVHHGGQSAC